MKVKDLIKKLSDFNQEYEVFIRDKHTNYLVITDLRVGKTDAYNITQNGVELIHKDSKNSDS